MKVVAEGGTEAQRYVVQEMVDAVQNCLAPTGSGASTKWLRMCSMRFLDVVSGTGDDAFGAALTTAIILKEWEDGSPTIKAGVDELAKWALLVSAAAQLYGGERLGLVEIDEAPVSLWGSGHIKMRLTALGERVAKQAAESMAEQ